MGWCLLFSGHWAASGPAEAVLAHYTLTYTWHTHSLFPCLPALDVFLARTIRQEHIKDEGISWEGAVEALTRSIG